MKEENNISNVYEAAENYFDNYCTVCSDTDLGKSVLSREYFLWYASQLNKK